MSCRASLPASCRRPAGMAPRPESAGFPLDRMQALFGESWPWKPAGPRTFCCRHLSSCNEAWRGRCPAALGFAAAAPSIALSPGLLDLVAASMWIDTDRGTSLNADYCRFLASTARASQLQSLPPPISSTRPAPANPHSASRTVCLALVSTRSFRRWLRRRLLFQAVAG